MGIARTPNRRVRTRIREIRSCWWALRCAFDNTSASILSGSTNDPHFAQPAYPHQLIQCRLYAAIGYLSHSSTAVTLTFQESFTFRVLTSEASVVLAPAEQKA
jgi:hypothetical protein